MMSYRIIENSGIDDKKQKLGGSKNERFHRTKDYG